MFSCYIQRSFATHRRSFALFYNHRNLIKRTIMASGEETRKEPFGLLQTWLKEAFATPMEMEQNAMTIATSTKGGKPSSRFILLKGYDNDGLRFFTNYNGRKGQELISNPRATLFFHWPKMLREISVSGVVRKLSAKESSDYFHSRPRGSQIGACISHQSEVIPNREILIERQKKMEEEYADESKEIPRPDEWGGFLLVPEQLEFRQLKENGRETSQRWKFTRIEAIPCPPPEGIIMNDSLQWTSESNT